MPVQGISRKGEKTLKTPFLISRTPSHRPSERDFRAMVEAHQSRVFSIAFRILDDCSLAEEVAQDVFLAFYQDLDRIESEEHALAWLRRVAVHRALDAHRRRASRVDYYAEEFLDGMTAIPRDGRADFSSSASSRVEQLVASLPAVQRAVVLLRYQEDMLPGEIASALSMPMGTVKSHLQRALKLLRAKAERQMKEVSHG